MPDRKTVGLDDILAAIRIREGGGSWYEVIDATGFNGATLRPHINRYLAREIVKKERAKRQVTHDDRVDSPYAVVLPVELSTESIDKVRLAGMSWYGIAEALGVSEAKVKGLASPEAKGRIYARGIAKVAAVAKAEWAWPASLPEPFELLAPIVAKAAKARSAKGRAKAWAVA